MHLSEENSSFRDMTSMTDPSSRTFSSLAHFPSKKTFGFSVEEILAPSKPRTLLETYYQQLHNNLLLQVPFVVPVDSRRFPTGENLSTKPKRMRTIFTKAQIERLEQEFTQNKYIVGAARLQLAAELSLSETQARICFIFILDEWNFRWKFGSRIDE